MSEKMRHAIESRIKLKEQIILVQEDFLVAGVCLLLDLKPSINNNLINIYIVPLEKTHVDGVLWFLHVGQMITSLYHFVEQAITSSVYYARL